MERKRKKPEPRRKARAASEPQAILTRKRSKGSPIVVGVGASAGGLEAFTELLSRIPEANGLAIVLVQHLAAKHGSILPHLLGDTSRVPVHQVTDGMRLEQDHVYVIPPNALMEIVDGKLHLITRPDDHRQFMPIDFFFRSLAVRSRNRAIAVVLSGTGTDGAEGIREIHEAGGITMAQEPQTARYDGMPRAAIATGVVDVVLSPGDLAGHMLQVATHPYVRQPPLPPSEETATAADEHLQKILVALRGSTGVDFTQYKYPTIQRRIQRRMALHRLDSIEAYAKFLDQNPNELRALYEDVLIHVTQFFRDPEAFRLLAEKVFPRMLKRRQAEGPIRVWVPGCATGEEAYSLAIALVEKERTPRLPIQIFATDVSESAIERARAGYYPENITADVSKARLERFFTHSGGGFRINKRIRDMCIFARQDLARDPPFSRLDLILCRNVLIYLGQPLQRRLLSIFHYALKPSGILMLGSAETIGLQSSLYSVFDKKHRIYTKKQAAKPDVHFAPQALPTFSQFSRPPIDGRARLAIQERANRALLARYAPPGVIVDSDLQILEFRGHTGRFLEPAPGDANLNLLKMAREGLLFGLRSALNEARKSTHPVQKQGLKTRINDHPEDVSIEVIPLPGENHERHYLVTFQTGTAPEQRIKLVEPRKGSKLKGSQDNRVERLERELAASREYLQSVIQDMEAANEELQSANEEILSSNEELQSTNEELDTAKEELQSTNEELNTLNEELQNRNEELSRANSDLLNLLGSVHVPIVIISKDLKIRRFTPLAEKILNLIPGDIGRPINHIKPNIICPDLESLITEVVETFTAVQRDVQDVTGDWHSLRIRPYKSADNQIDGAVLAMFDLPPRAARKQDSFPDDIWEEIVERIQLPLALVDDALRIEKANQAFCRFFDVASDTARNRRFSEVGSARWLVPEPDTVIQRALADNNHIEQDVGAEFPKIGRRDLKISAWKIRSGDGPRSAILVQIQDVTGKAQRGHVAPQ
jgi:two-component system CheB/CheR fusion protein